ncbi:unnamed protein product [Paramecium pentaurelia]|uniref:Uncharacterized protein n=1 Tax=Paramecium pentaurelia TaxID=43138 RepID=A0A8S1XBJ7_9CILI|nr:unnamed protein product [Paramecium pentaurelia]
MSGLIKRQTWRLLQFKYNGKVLLDILFSFSKMNPKNNNQQEQHQVLIIWLFPFYSCPLVTKE